MKVGDDQRKQIFNVGVDVFLREGGPISAPHVDQVLPTHLKLVSLFCHEVVVLSRVKFSLSTL